ncbi:hypothetical protein [Aquimarina aggregata]|uniref:hypothetical protein n=1 Tax=Aquimarina aggregata TaxID=1642818 RepID=UPI002492EBD8|nr:hypothetical protein [Aquimarina aggregata]
MENHNTNTHKKPLPWSPSKSQVYTIYVKYNKKTIKDEITVIMAKHRKKTEDQVNNVRILLHPEFVSLVKFLGVPKGYYAPDGFFESPV